MPDTVRVRNVSVQGDLEIPSLNLVIAYRHEALVPAEVAESLIESGDFTAVHRASDDPPPPEPALPAGSPSPADQQVAGPATTNTEEPQ